MKFYSHIWNSGVVMKAEDRHFLPGVLDLVRELIDESKGSIPGMAGFTYTLAKAKGVAMLSVYRLNIPIWTAGFYLTQEDASLLLFAMSNMANGIGDAPCRCEHIKAPGMITLIHKTSSLAQIAQSDIAMLSDFGRVMCAAWLKSNKIA